MAMRFKSQQDADEFQKQITQAALRWGRPIWWCDWQRPFAELNIKGASCFVLKFTDRCVGVTAAHVICELFAARQVTASLDCRIQLTPLNLLYTLIDMNDQLDIATFSISDEQVHASGVQPFDVSAQWPPPEGLIAKQMPLQLIGFPECLRIIDYAGGSVTCQAYGALALVEDYSDREIITVYDPTQCIGIPHLLQLGFNMSGCSGGPAVIHQTRNGVHRWYPVGLIHRGPLGQAEGDDANFDIIRIRRIDCIDENGRIQTPNTGWLPP
jgi:hypothetical protein